MDEKKKIIIEVAIGVVVLIIVVVVIVFALRGNGAPGAAAPGATDQGVRTGPGSVFATSSPTKSPVPSGTVVPNKGSTSTPANVAVPAVQGPGNRDGTVSFRSFNINIQNGAYVPSTIIVKRGDTVNIELTAIDANYGFTQPDYFLNASIPKGKKQTIQFQAGKTGDFTFYCASCGGPTKGPVGHIIVAAQ